jgi:hypothetical protein
LYDIFLLGNSLWASRMHLSVWQFGSASRYVAPGQNLQDWSTVLGDWIWRLVSLTTVLCVINWSILDCNSLTRFAKNPAVSLLSGCTRIGAMLVKVRKASLHNQTKSSFHTRHMPCHVPNVPYHVATTIHNIILMVYFVRNSFRSTSTPLPLILFWCAKDVRHSNGSPPHSKKFYQNVIFCNSMDQYTYMREACKTLL